MAYHHVPGVAIAVLRNGKVVAMTHCASNW